MINDKTWTLELAQLKRKKAMCIILNTAAFCYDALKLETAYYWSRIKK